MKEVPRDLIEFIRTGHKFLVAGHKEPDGDCVGSQLALCSALKRLGKEAIPCSAGPFNRREIKPYEKLFCPAPDEKARKGARVIIADCTGLERTGDLARCLEGLPVAYIDHHQTRTEKEDQNDSPLYIYETAPSVTMMVLYLIRALGLEVSKEEAEYLLFGLCTDTGFFRHGDSGSAETFEAAALMTQAGASPKVTYMAIHRGKSLGSVQLLARILSRAEAFFGGKLILTTEEYEEAGQFGQKSRDSDTLYQLLQAIEGTEAVAVIRQETPEHCTVGLRSVDQVDVAKLARLLGGGGHKNAAGLRLEGTIPDIKNKILQLFRLHLS